MTSALVLLLTLLLLRLGWLVMVTRLWTAPAEWCLHSPISATGTCRGTTLDMIRAAIAWMASLCGCLSLFWAALKSLQVRFQLLTVSDTHSIYLPYA